MLEDAAAGRAQAADAFARRYEHVIRAYLAARWRGSTRSGEIDDAVQEVFVECFRERGVLERAERDRPGGFRAFLYGVVRNVALRAETRGEGGRRPATGESAVLAQVPDDEPAFSYVFDRAWARTLMREAATLQAERAATNGPASQRRVELLRLRFQEDLPIREIAIRWQSDATVLHREYVRARDEFREALVEVVRFHVPEGQGDAEAECRRLLAALE